MEKKNHMENSVVLDKENYSLYNYKVVIVKIIQDNDISVLNIENS